LKFLVGGGGGGQLLEFFQLSTKILAQFLESVAGLDLVSSAQCWGVWSTSPAPPQYLPWQTLLGSEHLASLVDVVVSYLDGCQDQKLLELGLMLLDNLMRTNLQFKVRT